MTPGSGDCHIDGVEVGELKLLTLGSPIPILSVTYALVNTASGDRFGSGNKNVGWSDETMTRLRAFLDSVEVDVCTTLFSNGATTGGGVLAEEPAADGIPSL